MGVDPPIRTIRSHTKENDAGGSKLREVGRYHNRGCRVLLTGDHRDVHWSLDLETLIWMRFNDQGNL